MSYTYLRVLVSVREKTLFYAALSLRKSAYFMRILVHIHILAKNRSLMTKNSLFGGFWHFCKK
jgi:hypothetical protein